TLTALAYLWFADKPVDLGVFEVGMGGTWDATNLVRGDVAVLCPVGIDHKELGSTVGEVATEKAGIIKEGRTAVVREQRPEALAALAAALREAFKWERLHLVIGMFGDKDVEAVVRLMAPLADRAYAGVSSSPRAAPLERVEKALRGAGVKDVQTFRTIPEAVDEARAAAGESDLILVAGSFYTVADARSLFVSD